ncbi:hypothetical protein MMC25_008067 [Agyrium rufum]|nr:hypothetical protein [Agyrium rufum]
MPPQYRNYQQQTQRSPHATGSRRGPGPMVGGTQSQSSAAHDRNMAARHNNAAELDAAKRRASKPTDKNIPDGVEDIEIGDGVHQYRSLREVERRLDAAMMRKRLDLQQARHHRQSRTRRMRIWISNTVDNQPWQGKELDADAFDFNTGTEATYKVKIEGRLLDDEDEDVDSDEEQEQTANVDEDDMDHDGGQMSVQKKSQKPSQPRRSLAHFFKSISIDFDRNKSLQPDNITSIEWKKPTAGPTGTTILPLVADFDTLTFERKSDENINCTINLVRDENPERYQLSPDLAEILDCEEETRAGVLMGLWEYIKAMNLQQDEEKRLIQCDDRLFALFKQETISFPDLPTKILAHISALPPLKLPYTIRVDEAFHTSTNGTSSTPQETIYDVLVSTEDPLSARYHALTHDPSYPTTLHQIAALDERLAVIVQAIAHSKSRHAFFSSMSKDPATFVRRWTSSQKRDLEIILAETSRGVTEEGMAEEFRRGGKDGVWGTEGVKESVGLMMAKPPR